jgi:deoxyadenosine/deoxycytidine kinase
LNYIAVEGPIGVGKSSLARLLAERVGAKLVLESVEDNPFLEKFYLDIRGYAFQTQLFFLLGRHRQQRELAQSELFNEAVVSDYLFDKDRIFAYLNLTEHELALYERVYAFLVKEVPKPDLVVYLQARTDVLLSRVRQRGRPFESSIDPAYLDSLANAYNRFFLHYDSTPLLIVNTERLDFVANRDDFDDLLREIKTATAGRRFYSPRGKMR